MDKAIDTAIQELTQLELELHSKEESLEYVNDVLTRMSDTIKRARRLGDSELTERIETKALEVGNLLSADPFFRERLHSRLAPEEPTPPQPQSLAPIGLQGLTTEEKQQ